VIGVDVAGKVTRARTQLLLREPFFGEIAMRLVIAQRDDLPFRTMAVSADGHLYYDPAFVESLTELELKGIVAHEVLHVALSHLTRKGVRDEDRWGDACDYAVNDVLINAGFFMPKNLLYDKKFAGMAAEEIYNKLPPDKPRTSYDDHFYAGGVEAKKLEQDWKAVVAQAAVSSAGRGYMPAELESIISNILNPRVDWRTVLWQFVNATAKDDYRWSPPNRRHIHRGMYLPSLKSEEVEIAVAVDTSGSIGDDMLKAFISEVQSILELNMKVTLYYIECDAAVHKFLELMNGQNVLEVVGKIKGRGGTDFRPAFKALASSDIRPACLIYLTDGNGTFPKHAPDYAVLWMLTQDVEVPFGEKAIMYLEEE
jgi:predicted metal-dependent peptidase